LYPKILIYFKKKERFRSLIPSYIRDSSVAVIVYDISSKVFSLFVFGKKKMNKKKTQQ
jgi:Ras-related protein Rab-6A